MGSGLGCVTKQTDHVSSPSFQAQLDDIDGELARFDHVEGGLEISQGGVGSSVTHDLLEVVLAKRSRQGRDEVLEEANERCKKRAVFSNDLMVEADD